MQKQSLSDIECIILAGGLGTRLREAVPDLPKCMAEVASKPFISYVIDYLRMQGVQRFIFSLGYKSEVVEDFLQQEYPSLNYKNIIEKEPLGTGGAIQLCVEQVVGKHVIIVNGDTLFEVDVPDLLQLHNNKNSECTLALKQMVDFDRYGVVNVLPDGKVQSFSEKQHYSKGLINGGVYLLNTEKFLSRSLPAKFSFEKDYLERYISEGNFFGSIQEGYFIDIGIPEDYQKAQSDLQRPLLDLTKIDKSWTLFLDRDGVINDELVGHYVKDWSEFIFSKGVLDVFKKLSDHFGHIVVVSNQRGVGRGIMSEAALQSIHLEMQREVEIVGGRIDKIYYCTEKDDSCFFRKPNPGMALKAASEIPGVDLSKSIMVGNKPSDMKFGRYAGMYTVFIRSTNPDQQFPHPDIDAIFSSLFEFAATLKSNSI